MATPAVVRPTYPLISAQAFAHPADRAATAALASIPLLDTILKKLSEFRFEKALQQLLLADAVRLGEDQRPDVWQAHLSCLESLDIAKHPDLYLRQLPVINAMTVGSANPVIIVNSALVSSLASEETTAVLAHEAGHVLAEHVHYATVLAILQRLIESGMSPMGGVPLRAVVLVLLEWYRCAELSCDRAATLVVNDPLVICRLLMNVAGGGVTGLDLQAFLRQATDFNETEDLLARPGRWLTELNRTHPYAVRRVGELMRWVREGDFDRIRTGDYVRRGQEPPVEAQFKAATEHYRQRFIEIVDRVAGGSQKLFNQFASWLHIDRPED